MICISPKIKNTNVAKKRSETNKNIKTQQINLITKNSYIKIL